MGQDVSERLKQLSDEYTRLLRLQTQPVAVRMFKELQELESLGLKKPGKKLALCQLISQACYLARGRAATPSELKDMCPLGAACIGLIDLPRSYLDGRVYLKMYHLNEDVGKKAIESIPKFKAKEYAGLSVAPLERTPANPDVVIFTGNAAQMLCLARAYLYNKGGRLNFGTCTIAACADAIVAPMQSGKPEIVLPCNGFRIFALPSDTDIFCAVPGDLLEEVLEGLKFTHDGGVRYPTAWQHIDMELPLVFPVYKFLEEE